MQFNVDSLSCAISIHFEPLYTNMYHISPSDALCCTTCSDSKFMGQPLYLPIKNEIFILDNRVIPTGVSFVIPLIDIHQNPNTYPDPMTWNPDNFDPEKVAARPLHTFIPFGFGPRICIGKFYVLAYFHP